MVVAPAAASSRMMPSPMPLVDEPGICLMCVREGEGRGEREGGCCIDGNTLTGLGQQCMIWMCRCIYIS